MPLVTDSEVRVLERSQHPLSRKLLDKNIVKVLYRLHRSGHKGYLVGGGVRDLLIGRRPKDWDVGTDASPQRVRRLFRNSRIIGRRFRLVHVYYPNEIIEVSTFRRDPDPEDQRSGPDELLITDDNVFGSEREDAFRRDFTVNALFYNIGDFTIIDHVGGIDDLEARLIRTIGDPDVRFREDPVRMMRACELAARLEFTIEQETQRAIHRQREEIGKAAPARLTEELVQLLRCGHAGKALHWMMELGLLEYLLPEAYAMVAAGELGLGEYGRVLPVVDGMIAEGRELTDVQLLSALLLPSVLLRRHDVEALDQRPVRRSQLVEIVREILEPFMERFALSRQRREGIVQAMLGLDQLRHSKWTPQRRARFVARPFFEDALTLLEILLAALGEPRDPLAAWQRARESVGRAGSGDAAAERKPRRRRRRRRRGRGRKKKGGGGGS